MWFHRGREPSDDAGDEPSPDLLEAVFAESAAILDGRSVELYLREGRQVPPWAWLNSVAHCPRSRLEHLSYLAHQPTTDAWAQAVASIAKDLLSVSETQADFAERHLLVDLELTELLRPGRLGKASDVKSALHRFLAARRPDPPNSPK